MRSTATQKKQRLYWIGLITLFALLHLFLEMLTGGVRVHYPLMREDLPAVSNWWGLLVLPALGWITHVSAEKDTTNSGLLGVSRVVIYRLVFGLLYGAAMAAGFEFGLGQLPTVLLLGLLVGGIFYPVYRLELMLGFVMGMAYTFGAVIPAVVISIVALSSLLSHNAGRFLLGKFKSRRACEARTL